MPPSTWRLFAAKDSRCGWMTSLMTAQSHQRELGYLQGAGKPPGSRHDSPDELKEPHSTFCLTMAQYCPLLWQLFAIAGHKVMRREKIFGRSTIAIRNMLSGCRKRGFAREKPYSQFYPSPFTFSPETPINTGVVRGEGLAQPFTTLHPPFTLSRSSYIIYA